MASNLPASVDACFSEAFLHKLDPDFDESDPWSAHRVLNLPLRPLSLWHVLLLETIASPMMRKDGNPSPMDLRRAVAICRCRFREMKVKPDFAPLDAWRLAGKGFAEQAALFRDYVEDFLQRPDYTVTSREGGAPKASICNPPETLRMAADVIAAFHWDDRKVWELPLAEVYWYHAMIERARCAQAGAEVSFMDAEEREYQRKLKESGFASPPIAEAN